MKSLMKSLTKLFFALFVIVSIVSCEPAKKSDDSVEVASEANDETFDDRDAEKDAEFVVNAIASSYGEIKLAELAMGRAGNTTLNSTAEMLKKDHTKVVADLKALAATNGISVPMEQSDDAKDEYKSLSEEEDAKDFNKEWCNKMVDKHQSSINDYEERMEKTENVELRTWISQTLPTLKSHLEMLKRDEEKLSN